MAAIQVRQQLELSYIPDGLTFEITKVSSLQPSGYVARWDNLNAPQTWSVGSVLQSYISTTSIWTSDKSLIPANALFFKISGSVDGISYDTLGVITVNTTAWGRIERPDYSLATAIVGDSGSKIGIQKPMAVSMEIPDLENPDKVSVAVTVKDSTLAVGLSSSTTLGKDIMTYAIEGVLELAEDLAEKAVTICL